MERFKKMLNSKINCCEEEIILVVNLLKSGNAVMFPD
jgi:hypothetical protein